MLTFGGFPRWAALLASAALLWTGCGPRGPVYQNPDAAVERRVEDLLSRMTLEEKVSQLMNDSPAIDRLGIPAYNWWNECLHGVARAGRATVFPEPIGLAATWDENLAFRVATAISDEARAKNNEFVRRGKRNIYQGLTFWTPNINLFRDPRWGRGMETYGEDPYLTGRMAVEFIKGLEGDDPKYLKTVATAKHYAVHSGPEPLRHTFDAEIGERELRETYLPQFQAAVTEGGAWSVMCAYNRVDGQPACASTRLLDEILRKQWGFQGYVVSDCGAVGDIYLHHKTAPDAEHGVASALQAGTDLNCGVEYENLLPAARQGLVSQADIDRALGRLLLARFKLGMFDPSRRVKYAQIPYSENDSPAHRQLALEAARRSIVLLKNEGGLLPLSKTLKTIAVIGPNADDPSVQLGNYNGDAGAPVTPLEGIRKAVPGARVVYVRGSDLAAGLPAFEVVPASALFVSDGRDRRNGLTAEYFGVSNFDGKPHRQRELTWPNSGKMVGDVPQDVKPLFARVDSQIDFHWENGAPRQDMNDDDFGVRWTGYLSAPISGTYQLGAIGLNAFEIYLDGKPLVDFNGIHERSYQYAPVALQAGKLYALRVDFHEYVNDADIQLVWSRPDAVRAEDAVAAAREADAVVLVLGLSPRLEGEEMKVPVEGFEGGDRVQLEIPRVQQDLMEKVAAANKRVVLVLLNGSAVAVNWARDHVPAIVEAWYPGQAGGTALADVLFGDYNPSGRLPVTFYRSASQLPPFTDYSMKGRTYRFFEGEPLFPFGYGLSYTTFAYRNLSLPGQATAGGIVNVAVEVENTGKIAGEEVVELYVKTPGAPPAPRRSLAAFTRLALAPGEKRSLRFSLPARQISTVGADGRRMVAPGAYEISVGGKQPGFQGPLDAATTGVVSGVLKIGGPAKVVE
ncbi:MAG TPA: glycoside hydrolase family 3 C-terminal domain-containing protein [Bryobacteraceae bacterium]|nr:glycoside hydrolase family 3 C-terminal domain-containing protein [Bryobacteraceae bacterium]